MQHTADLAYAETGRIGHARQLQPETPTTGQDFYYPVDITRGICSNDSTKRPSTFTEVNVTLFETLEECCDYWYSWQEGGNCHRNVEIPPAASEWGWGDGATATTTAATLSATPQDDLPLFYYPQDLLTGKCSNDASQRPSNFDSLGFTLFFTAEQCCQYWYGWQEDKACLSNTPVDSSPVDPSGGTVSGPPAASPGTPPGQSGGQFYLVGNICAASANGVMGVKSFATQVECCTNIPDFNSRKDCCDESVALPADQLRCLLEEAADPVEKEQFYLSNGKCYSSLNGVMEGNLYESQEKCCYAIGSLEERHQCLWNQSGSSGSGSSPNQPPIATTKSSASQLARGSYLVAAVVCLCFQIM